MTIGSLFSNIEIYIIIFSLLLLVSMFSKEGRAISIISMIMFKMKLHALIGKALYPTHKVYLVSYTVE